MHCRIFCSNPGLYPLETSSKLCSQRCLQTVPKPLAEQNHPQLRAIGLDIMYIKSDIVFTLATTIQSLSRVWLFTTPWTIACQASLSITNSRSLPKLMSIELVMPSSDLILCHPLLLLPSIFPSIRVFSSESALRIRWPKYWSFSFNIRPSNEHRGLIWMDWLDLPAVQGTLKSLLQCHSSKSSILLYNSHNHTWPLDKP